MESIIINNDIILPDYIETNLQYTDKLYRIPTSDNVENRPIRRKIIESAYKTLLSQMMGKNYIKNDFLDENVFLIFRESYVKASNNAVRHWQSTYAILRLFDVIKYAKPIGENYVSRDIKPGFQTNNHYVELYRFYYDFKNDNIPYLNFRTEVILGRNDWYIGSI
jgi:hypothetical protein